jgi:capsular polysaccharide biosynthesis protein
VYSASVKILVGQERAIAENPFDVRGLQDMTGTVAQAVESRPIAEAVIEQEGLRTNPGTFLAENLEVSAIEETQFVTVSYRDSDPQRAQRVVNAVGDVFSKRMAEISPGSSGITVTVWERAVAPGAPISPNPVRNGLLGLMLGVVLGTGLAILVQLLDDSWRSPEEVEQVSGVPTLGVVPAFALPKGAGKPTATVTEDNKEGKGAK